MARLLVHPVYFYEEETVEEFLLNILVWKLEKN